MTETTNGLLVKQSLNIIILEKLKRILHNMWGGGKGGRRKMKGSEKFWSVGGKTTERI